MRLAAIMSCMTRAEVLRFMRGHSLAVQASVSPSGAPQAAVVGFVVSNRFEIFFETMESSRKAANLRREPRIALVIGGLTDGDERTVQYEGVADEPSGADLQRLQRLYFRSFPDGRQRSNWPGIHYMRARPRWIRYSDYDQDAPTIREFAFR